MGRIVAAAWAVRLREPAELRRIGAMRIDHRAAPVLALAALLGAGPALAEDKPAQDKPPEPAVQRIVNEDDNVRIEELRVRGQTQSIVVKSKVPGVQPYEVVPTSGARDPSQASGAAGQRVWHLFGF
jgi:hypothetical protein